MLELKFLHVLACSAPQREANHISASGRDMVSNIVIGDIPDLAELIDEQTIHLPKPEELGMTSNGSGTGLSVTRTTDCFGHVWKCCGCF